MHTKKTITITLFTTMSALKKRFINEKSVELVSPTACVAISASIEMNLH